MRRALGLTGLLLSAGPLIAVAAQGESVVDAGSAGADGADGVAGSPGTAGGDGQSRRDRDRNGEFRRCHHGRDRRGRSRRRRGHGR
jgi:hypothetical protein